MREPYLIALAFTGGCAVLLAARRAAYRLGLWWHRRRLDASLPPLRPARPRTGGQR